MLKKMLLAAVVATGLGVGGAGTALAHSSGGQTPGYGMMMGPSMMMPQTMPCPGIIGFTMHPAMMGHRMMMGHGMMSPAMMGHAMVSPGMMGPGMMSPGMMGPGMMSPGMMGPGMMGPGMMGPGMMGQGKGQGTMMAPGSGMHDGGQADLSLDEVRAKLEHWLARQGNPRLSLGDVKEEGEDTVVADIVTQDGSLADRLRVDRHTGAMQRVP